MGRTRIVIRRAIDCGRGRLPFLVGLAALIFIPLGLLDAVQQTIGGVESEDVSDLELLASLLTVALHGASSLLGQVLFAGAVAVAVISTAPSRNPSLRRIVRETRWGTLIAIDLLFSIGFLFSALLLIIPVFFFFARYALAAVLAEVEELGIRESFSRSAELTLGSRRLVLGVLFGAAAIGDGVTGLLQRLAGALGADGFIAAWIASSGVDILYNPLVALLSVAIVLELGAKPVRAHPQAGL